MASENGQIEVLKKLWEWAKEVLTSEEIQSMFLVRDESKRPLGTWH